VARTVVQLLERARPTIVDGEAGVAFRDRRGRLRLTPEVLDILGGTGEPRAAGAGIGWHELDGWGPADLGRAVAAPRGRWEAVRLRRAPDAQAWAAGVVVPDLLVGVERRRALVCAVRSAAHGARLAPIAPAATTGDPLVFVGDGTALGALEAVGARVLAAERFDVGTIVAALPDLLGPADDPQPFPRVA
jgi:hypothetical protein